MRIISNKHVRSMDFVEVTSSVMMLLNDMHNFNLETHYACSSAMICALEKWRCSRIYGMQPQVASLEDCVMFADRLDLTMHFADIENSSSSNLVSKNCIAT
ncbi:hypothetical protein AVEN_165551-1 [Araneus ventricosus]|uniref:Uncharacterized protein n=1 Tax=Araneus ventricosus TaxID=182803 RepID=A0A4Y2WDZ2_ARAVE|nr:hypothetical protein AVEN_165551-1 [Araneus ventricosus]